MTTTKAGERRRRADDGRPAEADGGRETRRRRRRETTRKREGKATADEAGDDAGGPSTMMAVVRFRRRFIMTLSSHHNIPELLYSFSGGKKNHQIFCRHQQKKFTSPVNVKVQTIWTYLTLTYLQCIECWSLSSSQCAGWLLLHSLSSRCRLILSSLRTLEFSRRPLTAPPSPHLITQGGCCVASHRAAVSSSRRPLTAPPSRHLITQAGCCVALIAPPSRPLVILSLRRPLVISSRHLVAASPLVTPPSRPLVVLSLRHHLLVLRRLVVALPLVVPPSRPLVKLPSCPLVACPLDVAWPPSNDFAAATVVAAVGGGTATTVDELTIVHCQKERGNQRQHQHENVSKSHKSQYLKCVMLAEVIEQLASSCSLPKKNFFCDLLTTILVDDSLYIRFIPIICQGVSVCRP